MNRRKTILIILLTLLTTIVVFFVTNSKQNISKHPSPAPSISSYNAPKEIKYDSSTDLKKELENINPQIGDSDF